MGTSHPRGKRKSERLGEKTLEDSIGALGTKKSASGSERLVEVRGVQHVGSGEGRLVEKRQNKNCLG